MNLLREFERQIQTLIQIGYPEAANLFPDEFVKLISPLEKELENASLPDPDFEKGYLPFVIVIKSDLLPAEKKMALVEKDGKAGITKLYPHTPIDFEVIEDVKIPDRMAYLLVDIDRGKDNRNLPPVEAMGIIKKRNRSPLTIDEGIAIVTHFPEFLMKNNCFSLLASRHAQDQRVPAIWINANKNPNLGWCWNGNPHTWLGSASRKGRIGIK